MHLYQDDLACRQIENNVLKRYWDSQIPWQEKLTNQEAKLISILLWANLLANLNLLLPPLAVKQNIRLSSLPLNQSTPVYYITYIKLYQHIRVSSCIPHFLSISHFLSIYLSIYLSLSLSPSLKADFCTLYHPFHRKQEDSFIVISFASFLFLQRSFVRSRSSSISEAIYVNCGLC